MNFKNLVLGSFLLSSTISANNLHITSLETDFTQTIVNDQNSKITYRGKMYATSAKNQALWEYNSPIEKKIYYKGGKELVIIEPELEQVIYAKLDKVPNILKLLQSAKKISENRLQTRFNGLTYTIETHGNKIEKISYVDEMQNSVIISFVNEKVNGTINSNKFTYTIPADYDILEQ
jgi:outer membrane lipoprotein carrier protein